MYPGVIVEYPTCDRIKKCSAVYGNLYFRQGSGRVD